MDVFRQKAIENVVETVVVPKTNNEGCAKTVASITTSVRVKINILNSIKAFRIQSKIENKSR